MSKNFILTSYSYMTDTGFMDILFYRVQNGHHKSKIYTAYMNKIFTKHSKTLTFSMLTGTLYIKFYNLCTELNIFELCTLCNIPNNIHY